MNKRPKCYITYCQKDIEQKKMEIIVEWMSQLCGNKIEFLFDGNVGYRESFQMFEEEIFKADAIIIFFSPNYKKRCLQETNKGVSGEYSRILYIHEKNISLQKHSVDSFIKNRKLIFSILFQGKKKESITNEFSFQKYVDMSDMTKFFENEKKDLGLSEHFRMNFQHAVKDILNEIITSFIEKREEYIENYETMLNNLFITTKGEHIDLPNSLFIKTDAYNRTEKQQKYLIVGRKGSGKTTVKNNISNIESQKYKGIISIIAGQFSTEETYQLFFLNEKIRSDIENNFSKIDSLKILWEVFINIYCIFVVYKEYLKNGFLNEEQSMHIGSLERTIKNIFRDEDAILEYTDEKVTKTIYAYVMTNLERYMEQVIKDSRNQVEYFQTDIKSSYNAEGFLSFLIGREASKDFYYILKFCNKKIFITLDGFDMEFEMFKRTAVNLTDSEEKLRRIEFENLWLMIFIETLIQLKLNSKLKNIIDLCLTIPVDRLESIKNTNRDFYKYHAYTIALSWSSYDLVRLIAFRLGYLKSVKYDNKMDERTLEDIMRKFYPNIPTLIQFKRSGYINMPLFLYILRKSFWRPRDIIRYYGSILTLEQNEKNFDHISVKRAIKDESLRIIEDEFFTEFANLCTNLKEVVGLFSMRKQILSYEEISEIINSTPFIIEGNKEEINLEQKLKLLYTIGFLGINPPKKVAEEQYLYDEYTFVFTEGTSPLRVLKSDMKYQCKFIIHPIFAEYLFLEIDYNNLICNYTWDYVNKIDCTKVDYIMTD